MASADLADTLRELRIHADVSDDLLRARASQRAYVGVIRRS